MTNKTPIFWTRKKLNPELKTCTVLYVYVAVIFLSHRFSRYILRYSSSESRHVIISSSNTVVELDVCVWVCVCVWSRNDEMSRLTAAEKRDSIIQQCLQKCATNGFINSCVIDGIECPPHAYNLWRSTDAYWSEAPCDEKWNPGTFC
jgi:hypothetical protein